MLQDQPASTSPGPETIVERPTHLRAVEEPQEQAPTRRKRSGRRITASKNTEQFFELPMEHSIVKATIIAKYFTAWMRIIKTRTRSGKMAYFDLFAGKGAYDDGTHSTPLLILKAIIADPVVREQIMVLFADKKPEIAQALRENILNLPDWKRPFRIDPFSASRI